MLFSHQLQIVSKPKQFLADIQTFLHVTLYTRFLKTNFLKEDSLLNFLVIYCRYQHSTQCANCLETKLGWERETAFALRAIGAAKAKLPRLQKRERTSALHNKLSLQQHYVMIFAILCSFKKMSEITPALFCFCQHYFNFEIREVAPSLVSLARSTSYIGTFWVIYKKCIVNSGVPVIFRPRILQWWYTWFWSLVWLWPSPVHPKCCSFLTFWLKTWQPFQTISLLVRF